MRTTPPRRESRPTATPSNRRSRARPGAPTTSPFTAIPNPLVTRRTDHRYQRPQCEGAFFARPTNGRTKTFGYQRKPLALEKELAERGCTRLHPKKDLRLLAQPCCTRKETCDRGRAHRAPLKKLAKRERTYTGRPPSKRAYLRHSVPVYNGCRATVWFSLPLVTERSCTWKDWRDQSRRGWIGAQLCCG